MEVVDGVGLLERAIGYALGAVHGTTTDDLRLPTPCRGWDLHKLLRHLNDSLSALQEAVDGNVAMACVEDATAQADPVSALRRSAARLLGSWARIPNADRPVAVGGCPVATSIVTATGAVELTVHGWDVARARSLRHPIPEALARDLLPVTEHLTADRTGLFDPPVPVPPDATPADRLVAHLGRRP